MTRFDYETLRQDLINIISSKDSLDGEILANSTTMRILEAFAQKLSDVSAYAEYLTRESKYSVAQNTSSIMTQIDLFGYKPHRKVGASGWVTVTATSHTNNIIIPKFTRFSNGEYTYCSTKDILFRSDMTEVKVPVIQGSLMSLSFSGNDTDLFSDDTITIDNDSVENSLYELRNNGIVCTEVDNWYDTWNDINNSGTQTYTYNNFEYKLKNKSDFSGVQLELCPESHDENDNFIFRYLITDGELGDCLVYNSINQVLDSVIDTQGYTVTLSVTNAPDSNGEYSGEISGGLSYETIEEMREKAPYTFNRWSDVNPVDTTYGGKLITKNDYLSAFKSIFPSYVFQIWTDYEIPSQIISEYDFINNCRIYLAGIKFDTNTRKIDTHSLDNNSYQELITPISGRKGLTDYFLFKESHLYNFYFTGEVYYDNDKTSLNLAKDQIAESLIKSYWFNDDNISDFLKYENNLYYSNAIGAFSSIPVVHHTDIDVMAYYKLDYDSLLSPSGLSEDVTVKEVNPFTSLTDDVSKLSKDGIYYFTTVERTTSEHNYNRLVKDIFRLVNTGVKSWKFQIKSNDNWVDATDEVVWAAASPALIKYIDSDAILNSIKIKKQFAETVLIQEDISEDASSHNYIYYDLAIRFQPIDNNCVTTSNNQILSLTDAIDPENGNLGVINPWKKDPDMSEEDWKQLGLQVKGKLE